jgi:hypothetical protein
MNTSQFDAQDPVPAEEPAGAERYLTPGEELRISSSDIQIKKFMFEAYLTNRRLFLIDQSDRKPGVTAKEIPVDSILSSYLEESPAREPVIVLSVRTADDDIRTMKMTFAHVGKERSSEAEEWVHLITHATTGTIGAPAQEQAGGVRTRASLSPEARALSDTMVFPPSTVSSRAVITPPGVTAEKPVAAGPTIQRALQAASPAAGGSSPIMFCFHCGKKLPTLANFCPFCGTRVHSAADEAPAREGHLHLPLHQYREAEPEEAPRKGGWWRFFRR